MMLLCVSWISFEQRKSSDTNYTLYVCDYCVVRHVIWSATLHWWSSTKLKQHYCCLQLHIWLISMIYMNSPLAGLIRCSPTPFEISLLPFLLPSLSPSPFLSSLHPLPLQNVEKNVPQLYLHYLQVVQSWRCRAPSTANKLIYPVSYLHGDFCSYCPQSRECKTALTAGSLWCPPPQTSTREEHVWFLYTRA